MEAITITSPLEGDYLAIFKWHIVKRTQMILARVAQAIPILPANILKQALHILDYSLELPEAWPVTRELLLTMAPKMEQAGHRDGWMPYLEQGIRQSRQLGDTVAESEFQLQLGILYQLRAKYEEARSHLETSAKGFERLKEPHNQARVLNRLAYVARLQRHFEEAISFVETAQRLLDTDDGEFAYSSFVLGLVALDKRNWPEAVRYCQQAFEPWEQADNQRMMGRSLMCLGVALERMKQYPAAIRASEQAIGLFEATQDLVYKAAVQMNLGNVYNALEQPDRALKLFLPAKKLFLRVQDHYSLAMVAHNMGIAYRKLQQWDEAQAAYALSIQHKQEMGNIVALVNSMDGLGLVYLEQSKLMEAKATFEDALTELAKIQGEPGYEQRLAMIKAHLDDVNKRISGE